MLGSSDVRLINETLFALFKMLWCPQTFSGLKKNLSPPQHEGAPRAHRIFWYVKSSQQISFMVSALISAVDDRPSPSLTCFSCCVHDDLSVHGKVAASQSCTGPNVLMAIAEVSGWRRFEYCIFTLLAEETSKVKVKFGVMCHYHIQSVFSCFSNVRTWCFLLSFYDYL